MHIVIPPLPPRTACCSPYVCHVCSANIGHLLRFPSDMMARLALVAMGATAKRKEVCSRSAKAIPSSVDCSAIQGVTSPERRLFRTGRRKLQELYCTLAACPKPDLYRSSFLVSGYENHILQSDSLLLTSPQSPPQLSSLMTGPLSTQLSS